MLCVSVVVAARALEAQRARRREGPGRERGEGRGLRYLPCLERGYRANCSELFRTVTGTEVFRTVPFGNTSGTLRNTSVVREHFGTLRNTQKEQNFFFSSFCSSCLARMRNQRSHNSQVQLSRGWCQVPGGTRMMVTYFPWRAREGGWWDQGSNKPCVTVLWKFTFCCCWLC